ncbi:porin [Psychrobium sp. MM17-31]|uniref:porin n=1 Tax=Psychrobium sp. MM17-31 TaxID=2917758 RepID=UPI001EF67072|nr:porin [Psychrobium sp. MM17-31]MCG7531247.1 porin [Psychrobium sp. MM17-31]
MTTFSKTLLAVATGLLFSGAAVADEKVQVYGKVNATLQSDDTGERETNVKSNASRIGVKGGIKLDNDLKAIYQVEWQVDVADDEKDNFKARSQWVGLQGNFGTVMLGRNDTAMKKSQGKIDLFNDYEADIKNLFSGDNRLDDTLTYISPKFNGFAVRATFIAEDGAKSDGENGTSLALMYGDSKLKKSKFYASVAFDSKVAGSDTTRVSVQGKLGDLKLGAIYNESEYIDGTSKGDGFLVSAAYPVGKATLKAQYQDGDDKKEGDVISVGVDYKLAKSVKLTGFYTDYSFEDGKEESHLAVGMEYKF